MNLKPISLTPKGLVTKKGPAGKDLPAFQEAENPFTIVAIGASAGGLEAVTALLKNLSPATGMAFIYVQHLSPDHKSLLVPLLSKVTTMKVQEIDDMEKMNPDNVYIIPNDRGIEVISGHIKLTHRPKNRVSNLSIDVLFSSLANTHKENVVGVLLSGNADDGTLGLKHIREAGGITFAQDDSAKFPGMPNSAIAKGVVDFVLSPQQIARELNRISKNPLKKRTVKSAKENQIQVEDPDLLLIFQLLERKKKVDFSLYKASTIKRRIQRRMLLHKIKTLHKYAELLTKKNEEVDLLHQDLLINVTEFFRDPDTFLLLKKTVLPSLLKKTPPGDFLRIWVAGCATGEEVYSIAILLAELQAGKSNPVPIQIFASDLSGTAINKARLGIYTEQQVRNVSPKRLQQFFTKSKDKYTISKSLRDICVFAKHNLLREPPFSRMDFISCRNLLIYLDTKAQKKVIATFSFALNEGGFLMLGRSETVGTSEDLFNPINKKHKLYSRKRNPGMYKVPSALPFPYQARKENDNSTVMLPKAIRSVRGNPGASFDQVLLANYTPPSVIINHDLEILEFRGATGTYLKHTSGKASFNILRMARPEIAFELRVAIHNAIQTQQPVSKTGIQMKSSKSKTALHYVNLEVAPLEIEGEEPLLLVVFSGQQIDSMQQFALSGKNISLVNEHLIKKLEDELTAVRSDMSFITRHQEVINEELQNANEEILSSNEELQSLNEELETSKEEIESTNEELTISSQELLARNQEVEELYSYYETILSAIQEPILILNKDTCIKSANKSFYQIFHLSEAESIGVPLHKLGDNQWDIPRLNELLDDILQENARFHNVEIEHTFPRIGHKIMLLNAHRITRQWGGEELIVLSILDITEVRNLSVEIQAKEKKTLEKELKLEKKALRLIEDSNTRYNMMLMQSPFAFAVLKGNEMTITMANDSIKELWGKGKQIEGKSLYEVLPEIKSGPVPDLLKTVFTTHVAYEGNEFLIPLSRKGKMEDVYFNFVFQPYMEADKSISGVTVIAYEVTEQVLAKNELEKAKRNAEIKTRIAEDALKAKQQFLSNMSHEIRTPMSGVIGFANAVLKTELDQKQREYLMAIKTSGDALVVLINDILDLAKADSGKMIFQQAPFNLSALLTGVLQLFEVKASEKNIVLQKKFDKKIPKIILGDALRLRQILLNLVSNAIKFTKKGSIILSTKILSENDESIRIEFTLKDTGIGIPNDRLGDIFNDFEQVYSDARSTYGGTGLGLAIVKQLLELQGGTIRVTSVIGKGSVFSFALSFRKSNPRKVSTKTEVKVEGTPDFEIKNANVLVVEDTTLNQLLMKIILANFGFAFDIAENGELAIKKLEKNTYDIILMDIQMPEMDGIQATAHIRDVMKSDIPIIALTADVTTMDLSRCRKLGMTDYISKPIDEKLLYRKMLKILNK